MDPQDCNLPVGTIYAHTVNILVKRISDRDSHYLTFHSLPFPRHSSSILPNQSPTHHETIDLTFFRGPNSFHASKDRRLDGYTICSQCQGLLYFDNFRGKIVICNPTTHQLKFLPSPRLKRHPNLTIFQGSGFGYDHVSDDYKIFRTFTHMYEDGNGKIVSEVFALKKNYWKKIEYHYECAMDPESGVHVRGSYYWQAMTIRTKIVVLSFNFASESFSTFSLPNSKIHKRDYRLHTLVDYDDRLAVITYKRPNSSRADNIFEISVLEEGSWASRFQITFQNDVVRPLGLKNELFFVEVKTNSELCQLWIYNLGTGMLKSLEIYDYPQKMTVFPYIESNYHLSDEKPMDGNYIDFNDPYDYDC